MARLAGSVHGVVVQITSRAARPRSFGSGSGAVRSKATWIDGEVCSSYSTSASASAVRSVMHQ